METPKLDPLNPPAGISRSERADGRIVFSAQWKKPDGKLAGTTVTVQDGDELAALVKAVAIRQDHQPAKEPRDQQISIRLTRAEKRSLNAAKGTRSLEPWSRDVLLTAAQIEK